MTPARSPAVSLATAIGTVLATATRLSPVEAAAVYAAAGLAVFPCAPGAKRPLSRHGFRDATSDPEQVDVWWRRWPTANIGLPTGRHDGQLAGRARGFDVLDIDVHPSGSGFPALARARRAGLVDGFACLVRTPSGGHHRPRNRAGQLGPIEATATVATVTGPTARSGNDTAINLGLAGIATAGALAGLLRAAGSIAAWLTGGRQPAGNLGTGLAVLAHPARPAAVLQAPGLNPVVYWGVVAVSLLAVGVAAWLIVHLVRAYGGVNDPRRRAGLATGLEINRVASGRALRRRGGTLRPSLHKPAPADVGYLLGRAKGRQVWASVEDSMLLIGPPRSGKGLHIVINAILDAPGPVVTTSTRPDNLTVTLTARQHVGPVAVFDPQRLAPGLPAGLRWSPVRGCEDPLTAMIRAAGLAAGTGLGSGGVEGGGFWEGKTAAAIQALLHAAALAGRDARTLYQWALNSTAAADAVHILQTNTDAAEGWADSLESMIDSDPRTRDSIWQGVGLAFNALADPRVLDAVTPHEGEDFDPDTFLAEHGTLYLLATGAGAGASAALVAAFIEDLTETARRHAARSPGARLDPPLLLALDEIGNLAPLPSLPVLMADGGGTGVTTLTVLQSMAQARQKWGENQAAAIWDAAIAKIILGGASHSRDLQDLATLIGERDETTDSTTTDPGGGRSHQRSIRRVPILPPDALRTMPFGMGTVLLRAAPPIIADLRPWTARPDAAQLTAQRRAIEQALRAAA